MFKIRKSKDLNFQIWDPMPTLKLIKIHDQMMSIFPNELKC